LKKLIVIGLSAIVGAGCIGLALWASAQSPAVQNPNRVVSKAELATKTGVNGHDCWVAVDGKVYDIRGFAVWEMGQHTPSHGLASCGRDLSQVILQSPHGKKVLDELTVVGKLGS
jgi:predicted heme/steroid binding protein